MFELLTPAQRGVFPINYRGVRLQAIHGRGKGIIVPLQKLARRRLGDRISLFHHPVLFQRRLFTGRERPGSDDVALKELEETQQ
jgi:hypothetical protein